MLKILEKYKKYVLVVGGSLLMIAFIMPSAVNQMRTDPGKRVIAFLGEEKVRAGDLSLAHREFTAMTRLAPLLVNNLGLRDGDDKHWFLMTKEAEHAGMVGAETDGELFLNEMVELVAIQIAQARYKQMAQLVLQQPQMRQQLLEEAQRALPNMAAAVRRDAHLTDKEFYLALAKLRGALRLTSAYMQAGRVSDRRLIENAVRSQSFVGVDTVVIPASRLIDRVAEPTEQQITEHFEKYRDVVPGTGENGLGYRQPERLKVGWVFIDALAITDAVRLDTLEVNKRWRKENPSKPGEEFAKDRAGIEETMRTEQVQAVLSQIDKFWKAQVQAATRRLAAEGQYKKIPSDWEATRPTLQSLAQGIVDGVKAGMQVEIPAPAIVMKDASWLTMEDFQLIPGIGQSFISFGNRRGPTAEVLFSTRELLDPGTQSAPTGIPVQVGVPIADVFAADASGNRYYMVVLDARKAQAAESVEEVRDQVVRGLKTLAAYDVLVTEAPKYEAMARSAGLEEIQKLFALPEGTPPDANVVPVEIVPNVLVSDDRVGGSDPRIQTDQFREAATAIGARIDPLQPVTQLPADQRTFMVPLPGSLSLGFGQVVSVEPLTVERYRMVAEAIVRQEQVDELTTANVTAETSPFSVASLESRLKFRFVEAEQAAATKDATK
ncbi:MAG: hypothetical protein GIKADHBN_01330 [Phycisphaerales bacterium]|nr:hypothetical protein [Phycisphaerales bacterium]